MKRDDEINAVLRECAQASGLHIVSRMNGGGGFERREDSDEVEARLTATFQTFLPQANARPIAEIRLGCAAALELHSAAVAVLIRDGVAKAKRELIDQMKATIARLEALP